MLLFLTITYILFILYHVKARISFVQINKWINIYLNIALTRTCINLLKSIEYQICQINTNKESNICLNIVCICIRINLLKRKKNRISEKREIYLNIACVQYKVQNLFCYVQSQKKKK